MRNLRQPSEIVTVNGVNALELIESQPVSHTSFLKAVAQLEANFGTEYNREKTTLLFDMVREEQWSEERFNRTLKWFLKNKPFPAWTTSDWFSFSVKLFPYEWYLKQCREGANVREQMDIYELPDGTLGYRFRDGQELPFLKVVKWSCRKCTMNYYSAKEKSDCGLHAEDGSTKIIPLKE